MTHPQRRVLAALANSPQSLYSTATLLASELDKSVAQQATQARIYDGDVTWVDGRFVIVDPPAGALATTHATLTDRRSGRCPPRVLP